MAWILDEYSKFHGYSPAVVTGKPTVSIYIYIYIYREREREREREKSNSASNCGYILIDS